MKKIAIKLEISEFQYLTEHYSKSELIILSLYDNNHFKECNYKVVLVDEQEAEQIREWACDELVLYGFDENYRLNNIGVMMENFVDLFYWDNKS